MRSVPIHDATAPIVCTASSDEIPIRIDQIEQMRHSLVGIERTDDGLLLHFPNRDDVEAHIRRFTVDEKACCRFWGFAIETDDDQLTLRWDGPPDATDFMDRLFDYFQGDEPLTAISGLL